MTDETCQERIGAHLASRSACVGALLAAREWNGSPDDHRAILKDNGYDVPDDDSDIPELADEILYELPLAVSTSITLRVDLSTGGPADYMTATVERTEYGTLERTGPVVYHFADWFDHAQREIDDTDPLVDWFDSMTECATLDSPR